MTFSWQFLFLSLFLSPPQVSTSSSTPSPNPPSKLDSIIVCAVDGSVYTLDAWTGSLKGMFKSGPAVVSSSTMNENLHHNYNYNPLNNNNALVNKNQLTIVPGLDGLIYTLSPSGELDMLSVSAMDVVETPMATCDDSSSPDSSNSPDCGILMGEKHSKVFALDVSSGSVRWVQFATDSSKGFTMKDSRAFAEANEEEEDSYVGDDDDEFDIDINIDIT
ncbi:hypothetical protein ScalyP_jg456, partial [Parmales sp. scaly parma]